MCGQVPVLQMRQRKVNDKNQAVPYLPCKLSLILPVWLDEQTIVWIQARIGFLRSNECPLMDKDLLGPISSLTGSQAVC